MSDVINRLNHAIRKNNEEIDDLKEQLATLQKDNDILKEDAQAMRSLRACIRSDVEDFTERGNFNHDLMFYIGETRQKVETWKETAARCANDCLALQKDNDTLNTDLKEAEGAVSDLMELNDSLKAESNKYAREMLEEFSRANKAEAERDRLRRLISEAIEATNPNIVDNLLFEAINPHQYALLQPEALNHKEG